MRAHIICTAAISGQVRNAVHSRLVPNCAPAIEYVAMPDGSSSAAPVMRPGPRASRKRRSRFGFLGRSMRNQYPQNSGERGQCHVQKRFLLFLGAATLYIPLLLLADTRGIAPQLALGLATAAFLWV